jgi:hypothetical protein
MQHQQLHESYQNVAAEFRVNGKMEDLKQGKLHELVATDFIERHLQAQEQTDNYGFGGMIRERDVGDFLIAEGFKITEGDLGLRFKPDNPYPNSYVRYQLLPCSWPPQL